MKLYLCPDCWHEVYGNESRAPQSIHWTDGHVCHFKSPEDMPTEKIISFEKLLAGLRGVDVPEELVDQVNEHLRVAYEEEVKLMCRYALKAKLPEIILHPFRTAGSQHIAEFEVKDRAKPDDPSRMNFHMQNTSQWVYAGCILYDERDSRVSRHH
ncbi:MAG: hypothetical protein AM326_01520 [Candidatus Thorarchaeota archaeon SMTZ-45]|nr:MAG: hypothetical protein AM326_01520 [Candidatus Thorarchaeota archaeon SMTZ-45]